MSTKCIKKHRERMGMRYGDSGAAMIVFNGGAGFKGHLSYSYYFSMFL